ncbi:MAG: hypothetical protein COU69_02880, partial [Candidatus Pacebacteria bacterium CG10_big_fil_rev_8_21_14_0_10_56_10]
MNDQLPDPHQLVSIGRAAAILGVSVDTVRRWDKKGQIKSVRPDGRNRYFAIEELRRVQADKKLTITEAARELGLSDDTLRRWEDKGVVKPLRDQAGARQYAEKQIEQIKESTDWQLREREDYQDRQRRQEAFGPDAKPSIFDDPQILTQTLVDFTRGIHSLKRFRRGFYLAGSGLTITLMLLVVTLTVLFLMFPQQTAEFFGYRYLGGELSGVAGPASQGLFTTDGTAAPPTAFTPEPSLNGPNGRVLSSAHERPPLTPQQSQQLQAITEPVIANPLSDVLKPFSKLALVAVGQIDSQTAARIVTVRDDRQFFRFNADGSISPLARLNFSPSSQLR